MKKSVILNCLYCGKLLPVVKSTGKPYAGKKYCNTSCRVSHHYQRFSNVEADKLRSKVATLKKGAAVSKNVIETLQSDNKEMGQAIFKLKLGFFRYHLEADKVTDPEQKRKLMDKCVSPAIQRCIDLIDSGRISSGQEEEADKMVKEMHAELHGPDCECMKRF